VGRIEVGKYGPLFLFDLTRGLEKAGVEARQVGKLRIAGRECPGSRVFTNFLESIDGRLTFPLLEMLVLRPPSVLVTSPIVVARQSSSSRKSKIVDEPPFVRHWLEIRGAL
jgi:hypothetical protein